MSKSGKLLAVPSRDTVKKYKTLWAGFRSKVNSDWLKVYISISGINDYRYIPEDIYYSEIEPRLNDKTFSKADSDKNSYHKIFSNTILPPVLLRSISGILYTEDYKRVNDLNNFLNSIDKDLKYIIKPSVESGGGTDVRKIEITGDRLTITPSIPGIKNFSDLIHYYKRDFIIQKYLEQHSFFRQFNKSSLNTIRIFTYRSLKDEKIVVLHRILRIGKPGSVVDNQASGGIACGISEEGLLSSFGVDKYGSKYSESNMVKFCEIGKIPFLEAIISLAEEVAGKYLYSRVLGLDFAVNEEGKIFLIEVNNINNEINFYQMNNGPLFGIYSEDVARLCLNEPKSILLDYYL